MRRKYTVKKLSEAVNDILHVSFELRSVKEYVTQHSFDKDEEAVVYCVVFPNEISIYHHFEEIVNLHKYLEELSKRMAALKSLPNFRSKSTFIMIFFEIKNIIFILDFILAKTSKILQ